MGQNDYNIMNQGYQAWISSFPRITFDMWHTCVGLLFQNLQVCVRCTYFWLHLNHISYIYFMHVLYHLKNGELLLKTHLQIS
jgi:hypothetical protein